MASYPYHEDPPSYISLFPDAVINTNTGIQVRFFHYYNLK